MSGPGGVRFVRSWPVAVALIVISTVLALTPPAAGDEPSEWAGDWVVWEGYQTGEEAWIRLEQLDTDRNGFEANLPEWAERLRGLCDPDGRFYGGIAGYGSEVDPTGETLALACDARSGIEGWSQQFRVFGAMSGDISALAPGAEGLSLFGLGNESPEIAPFAESPSDRYFWGATIEWTPTADNPQGNRGITGANDWHGRCMAGPCAPGAGASTTTAGTQPTVDQEASRIGIENPGRECGNSDAAYQIGLVKTPTRDFNFLSWSSLPEVTQASAGAEITIPEGFTIGVLGVGIDGRLREIVAAGPSRLTVPCDTDGYFTRFLRYVNPQTNSLPGRVLAPATGLFKFPGDLDPWDQAEEVCKGDDPPLWCYRPILGTPMVTAGVLGTEFLVEVTETTTEVIVLEGRVVINGTTSGQRVVDGGFSVSSDGSSVSEPEVFDLEDIRARHPWLAAARSAVVDVSGAVPAGSGSATGSPADGSSSPLLWIGGIGLLAALGLAFAMRSRRTARPAPPMEGSPAAPPPPPPPPPP